MAIRDIHTIFVCMYYGMFMHGSTNYYDSVTNSTFNAGAPRLLSRTLHTTEEKETREGGNRRGKPDRMSRKYKKSQASDHYNFV